MFAFKEIAAEYSSLTAKIGALDVKQVVTNQIWLYLNIEEIWLVRKHRMLLEIEQL